MCASYAAQGWPRQQANGDVGLSKSLRRAFRHCFRIGLNGAPLRAAVTSILAQRGFAFTVAARTQNYEQPPNDPCKSRAPWGQTLSHVGRGGCGELSELLQDMQRIAPCSSPRESDGGHLSGCAPALLSTPGHTCAGAGLSLVIRKASRLDFEAVTADRAGAVAAVCASRTLDAQRGLWSTEGCPRAVTNNSANERACAHTCFSRAQTQTPC